MVQESVIEKKNPPQAPQMRLRLRFRKTGRLRYISHLDLVRTMTKAVSRAKLPVWYTQGFNPVPKMVFAVTACCVCRGSSSRQVCMCL